MTEELRSINKVNIYTDFIRIEKSTYHDVAKKACLISEAACGAGDYCFKITEKEEPQVN